MRSYLYETHLHTYPVSKCAKADVRESLEFYKKQGYDGVFITNHFIDGNINYDKTAPYEERIEFYFSDYEKAVKLGKDIGISVFLGIESSYHGTDFLIYGLDKAWFLKHPEIEAMKRSEMLTFMAEQGAFIVQAHPYREARYIDHIRLFPRNTQGVEVYNAACSELANTMAEYYAKQYDLIPFAGSDNHSGARQILLGGMQTHAPVLDELDFIKQAKCGEMTPFKRTVAN